MKCKYIGELYDGHNGQYVLIFTLDSIYNAEKAEVNLRYQLRARFRFSIEVSRDMDKVNVRYGCADDKYKIRNFVAQYIEMLND